MAKLICSVLAGALVLSGCQGQKEIRKEQITGQPESEAMAAESESESESEPEAAMAADSEVRTAEPAVESADWSGYFDGLEGAAVVYDASAGKFAVYQETLADARRSPCSTFKIVSSLIALEDGVIVPDNSVRSWSGEQFWNDDWNQDLDFETAFRTSCVWYFREVADVIGQERVQEALEGLFYGNCDISDWEGRQNTNNNNRALTGFWLESSLGISPKEQTEVMARIFGENSVYSENAVRALKSVMLLEDGQTKELSIYGKTGMGKTDGTVADAWFVGFAEGDGEPIYFSVWLGPSGEREVSSQKAREIAVQIVSDWYEK